MLSRFAHDPDADIPSYSPAGGGGGGSGGSPGEPVFFFRARANAILELTSDENRDSFRDG